MAKLWQKTESTQVIQIHKGTNLQSARMDREVVFCSWLTPAPKSWLCTILPNIAFSNFKLVS